jgi:glycerol 2-dehydrogenase (NADP+)
VLTFTRAEMQKLLETGQVKNIGVSNFVISNLEKLLNDPKTKVVPAVNQIELHPNMPSPKTLEYCKSKNIHCTAYSCLGSTDSPLASDKTLGKVAQEVGKTPQQVLLQWGLARNTSVIPKSVTASRIKGNFELDGWDLTDEQVKTLSNIPDRFKVCGHDWLPVKVFVSHTAVPSLAHALTVVISSTKRVTRPKVFLLTEQSSELGCTNFSICRHE